MRVVMRLITLYNNSLVLLTTAARVNTIIQCLTFKTDRVKYNINLLELAYVNLLNQN